MARSPRVFDSWAIVALLEDEPAAEKIEPLDGMRLDDIMPNGLQQVRVIATSRTRYNAPQESARPRGAAEYIVGPHYTLARNKRSLPGWAMRRSSVQCVERG